MAFRALTFNAGLAVGVLPYVTERLPHVIEALAALDVDLLFVQEFWLDAHWDKLTSRLERSLPHTFRPKPAAAQVHGACAAEQLEPLTACAEAHCAGLRDEQLARCVVGYCASAALSLPTACLNCIASQPVGTLREIVGRCVGEEAQAAASPSSGVARYGGLIAYGGSFGTGLLSNTELSGRDVLVFDSTVNARGALYARVRVRDVGELHVFAVHLSPGGAEQPPQVARLLAWIEEKARQGPALLLGDLNTTPDSPLFEAIRHAGFAEPEPPDRRGTYLRDGLGTGRVGEPHWRLDHILTRGLAAAVQPQRVLERPVTVDVAGTSVRTTLSDHLGVLATITAAP